MISTIMMIIKEKMTITVEDVGLIVVDLITTAVIGAVAVIGVITRGKFPFFVYLLSRAAECDYSTHWTWFWRCSGFNLLSFL